MPRTLNDYVDFETGDFSQTTISGDYNIITGADVKAGTYAARSDRVSSGGGTIVGDLTLNDTLDLTTSITDIYVGGFWKFVINTNPSSESTICRIVVYVAGTGSLEVDFQLDSSGLPAAISFWNPATSTWTQSAYTPTGMYSTYQNWEGHFVSHGTNGYIELFLNGVLVATVGPVNTGGGNIQSAKIVTVAQNGLSVSQFLDNLYWSTAPPGSVQVVTGATRAAASVVRVATVTAPSGAKSVTGARISSGSLTRIPNVSGGGTGATTHVHIADNLQTILNNALPGDTILLDAGVVFTGNFVLPVKAGSQNITIQSNTTLPAAGTRVSPATAANFAKIQAASGGLPALATVNNSHHWQIIGVTFPNTPGGFNDIIDLGDGGPGQNSVAVTPHHILIDRCYIYGDPVIGQKRGISLQCAYGTIKNCYINDIKAYQGSYQTQGIGCWNGPGPLTIDNNFIAATGENILFGGASVFIDQMNPSDITVTNNYCYKDPAWKNETGRRVCNLFELKCAQRVTITDNIFENNWPDEQGGIPIVFTVRNQEFGTGNPDNPWANITDVVFKRNKVINTAGFVNILGHEDRIVNGLPATSGTMQNVLIEDNECYGNSGNVVQVHGPAFNITINHNTVVNRQSSGSVAVYLLTTPTTNFKFTNNIINDNGLGVFNDVGAGVGTASLAAMCNGWTFAGNVLIGCPFPSSYPAGNFFPALETDVYRNPATNDYRLKVSSPYLGAGTDSLDIGALFIGTGGSPPPPPPVGGGVPPPWVSEDIGSVGITGSASVDVTGAFTLSGSGADIWSTADAFQFVHRPFAGNGTFTIKVLSVQNTGQFAKAGIMFRGTLAADSAFVMLDIKPDGSWEFMRRPTNGAAVEFLSNATLQAPAYCRLIRAGTSIVGQISADGASWSTIGSTIITLPDPVHAGMIVCSHDNLQLNVSSFSVQIVGAATQVFASTVLSGSVVRGPFAVVDPTDAVTTDFVAHPVMWQEVWIKDGTDLTAAEVDLNDDAAYYGGHKPPTVDKWQPSVRQLSDLTGQITQGTFGATLSDVDRTYRSLLSDDVNRFLTNRPYVQRIIDDAGRRTLQTPRIFGNGFITDYTSPSKLQFSMVGGSWLKKRFARRKALEQDWQTILDRNSFADCPGATVGLAAPIWYGHITDDPAGDSETAIGAVPTMRVGGENLFSILGEDLGRWQGFLIGALASKNVDDAFLAGVRVASYGLAADLLVPGKTDWATVFGPPKYRDLGGRRWMVIYARGAVAEAAIGGTGLITVNLQGVESIGDCSGTLLEDPMDIYLHFVQNFLALDPSYKLGPYVTASPEFPTIPGLSLVDVASFAAVKWVMATNTNGIPVAAIGLGVNGEHLSYLDVLARFNVSWDLEGGFNYKWQYAVWMEPNVLPDPATLRHFDEINDIKVDTFQMQDQVQSKWFNYWPFAYGQRYVPLPSWDTVSNPNWESPLTAVAKSVGSIVGYDQTRLAAEVDFHALRSTFTGDAARIGDMMARKVRRYQHPWRVAQFVLGLSALDIELGDCFTLSTIEGVGLPLLSGWVDRILRCIGWRFDPDTQQVALTAYDLEHVINDAIPDGGPELFTATGGTIVDTADGWRFHTFTGNGTFTVTAGRATVQILLQGGGGTAGTGFGGGNRQAGGGGGQHLEMSTIMGVDAYAVTVGGAGGLSKVQSSFGTVASVIGGGVGGFASVGGNGASGGGGSSGIGGSWVGGVSTIGGHKGGNGWDNGVDKDATGGGGGIGSDGGNGHDGIGGNAGLGLHSSFTGVAKSYGAGGAGFGTDGDGVDGEAGYGKGGKAPYTLGTFGVVIIKYPIAKVTSFTVGGSEWDPITP